MEPQHHTHKISLEIINFEGADVKITFQRLTEPLYRGGCEVATLYVEVTSVNVIVSGDSPIYCHGETVCSPRDTPRGWRGRRVALARALKPLKGPGRFALKQAIWEACGDVIRGPGRQMRVKKKERV